MKTSQRGALSRDADSLSVDEFDARGLERSLRRVLHGEVRFDTASKALYSADASNFRQVPIGVVIPRTIDDVLATHAACRRFGAPIVCRGAGTSLSGETVNVAVVIDFSKYLHHIVEIDAERRLVRVQPGAINDQVNDAVGEHGLLFGPDPSTHAYCTIGGNVGNNSCGTHSVQAQFDGDGARTSDNVHELEVLTYDGVRLRVGGTDETELARIIAGGGRRGEIYLHMRDLRDRYAPLIRERFVNIPRRVSGYNLDDLLPEKGFHVARALTGTEGTCVSVLEATLQLIPKPTERSLLVVGCEDVAACGDLVPEVMEHRPLACEGISDRMIADQRAEGAHAADLKLLPPGNGWLLVEFGGGTKREADERAQRLMADLKSRRQASLSFRLFDKPSEEKRLWAVREAALASTSFPPDSGRDHWPGWEDSAVPPHRVGDYLRDLQRLFDKHGYTVATYGHFGQGCIHCRIDFELTTAAGVATYRRFMEQAADLVVSYGGSLSGEHGDGQQRAELLPRMFGSELVEAFREFKAIWDPQAKMNPGKVVDAYRLDENLKLGVGYSPWRPATKFSFINDANDVAHAALRCVGAGKCRTPGGAGVMCPSFVATREEKHTTRGRAHLLFEMLNGEVITDRWRSKEVFEALDLCLACKGCTNDCPVNVDIPTLKSEFLHHHWKHRLRPRHAYAFGLIDQVSRVASRVPGIVNVATSVPPLSQLVKFTAGITQRRAVPQFAPLTLREWFAARGERNPTGSRVLLWPDTFNNTFHTEVGVAAVESLEAAGYHVVMPSGHVCCGRPLYDYGFLDLARKYLTNVLDTLRDEIRAGTPVVGIEPSCVAVFKDELPKLLPNDDDAKRLTANVYHFAEFMDAQGVRPPALHRKALVWGHCHQKATGGMGAEMSLLRSMGVDAELLSAGCCGLAGSFGFEASHYDISMACGEQGLLPSVRDADAGTLIVADGFSCKTQIQHGTTRRALHIAEVIRLARMTGAQGPPEGQPDSVRGERPQPRMAQRLRRLAPILSAGAAAVVAVFGAAWITRRCQAFRGSGRWTTLTKVPVEDDIT